MVSAKLIQISAKGPIDNLMYGNPQITFFRSVFRKPTNFATNYVTKPALFNSEFGKSFTETIPREGDLLAGVYIRFKLSDLKRKYRYFSFDQPFQATAGAGFTDPNFTTPQDSTTGGTPAGIYDPQFTSFCNGIGSVLIEEVNITVGNKVLESMSGEWIFLNNELHNNSSKKENFYNQIFYNKTEFIVGESNTKDMDILVPIPFFFTKDSGSYLPIIAMINENLEITVKMRSLEKCLVRNYQTGNKSTSVGEHGWYEYETNANGETSIVPFSQVDQNSKYNEDVTATIDNLDLIYKFYHLDDTEKNYFIQNEHRYVVPITKSLDREEFNYSNGTFQQIPTEIRNPTKYFTFVLQRKDNLEDNDYFNFTSVNNLYLGNQPIPDMKKNLLEEFNIELNGNDLFESLPSKILNDLELYSKFQTNSNVLLYTYSFALYPNDVNPSGSLNFTQVMNQVFKLKLIDPSKYSNKNVFFRCYSVSYNVLTVKDGFTGFQFY